MSGPLTRLGACFGMSGLGLAAKMCKNKEVYFEKLRLTFCFNLRFRINMKHTMVGHIDDPPSS